MGRINLWGIILSGRFFNLHDLKAVCDMKTRKNLSFDPKKKHIHNFEPPNLYIPIPLLLVSIPMFGGHVCLISACSDPNIEKLGMWTISF